MKKLSLSVSNSNVFSYLEIIDAYVQKYDLDKTSINIHKNALSWAVQRGSRSGRVAWQFILDLAGKIEKNITL